MSRSKTTTLFTLGFITLAAVPMAIAVCRGPAYQLGLSILVAAILVAIGFSLGTTRITAAMPWWKPFSFGSAFTLVFGILILSLAEYLNGLGLEQALGLLFLGFLTFASSFLAAKLFAWFASSTNPTLNQNAPISSTPLS